ncbi:hypothetical protein BKA64DRAFT_59994 [Cadophora sp. MPI-SDFR-AT-0126]|nr:hypothetical protein BKA64DRAFT_59994 [Leotiomycetes sp. MPI-SDFR-AT-0126]
MLSISRHFHTGQSFQTIDVFQRIRESPGLRNSTGRPYREHHLGDIALADSNTCPILPNSNYASSMRENIGELSPSSYTESAGNSPGKQRPRLGTANLGAQHMRWLDLFKHYRAVVKQAKTCRGLFDNGSCHVSRGSQNEGGDRKGETTSTHATRPTASCVTSKTLGKRKHKPDEYAEDEDADEDEDGRGTKRVKRYLQELDSHKFKFACPFRKRDPQTYTVLGRHTRCVIAQLKSVSRVKEHLFRCHLAPIHCPRCWCEFDTLTNLEDHIKAENICKKRDSGHPPKGITAEQERILRSRKKSPAGQSEEERWMEIYQLLFPNEPCPTSPYVEEVDDDGLQAGLININRYRDYAQRESPNIIRSQLARLGGQLQSLTSEDLIWVFQQCHDTLLLNYSLPANNGRENTGTEVRDCQPMGHDLGSTTSSGTSNPIDLSHSPEETISASTDLHLAMFPAVTSSNDFYAMSSNVDLLGIDDDWEFFGGESTRF